jgi:hypothetical protein
MATYSEMEALERMQSWSILKQYPSIHLEGLKKPMENFVVPLPSTSQMHIRYLITQLISHDGRPTHNTPTPARTLETAPTSKPNHK